MRFLVLGGTRFFGKTLVEGLVAAGHAVTVLSRGNLPPPAGAAHLVCDRGDPAALRAALAGRSFDAVVDNVAMSEVHVLAALDLLAGRAGHYVFTSTISVYGDLAHGRFYRESDLGLAELEALLPGGDPYTVGKREAERTLWRGSPVPFTVVRPGYVMGPHDHRRRLQYFVQRVLDGGPVVVPSGTGDIFQLAWHADVAAAMARVLGDAATFGRAYNLVGLELFTYPTLVRALGEAAGVQARCLEIPREALRTGVLATEELPFGEEGAMYGCDTRRLEDELGVRPVPAAVWMEEMVRACRAAPAEEEEEEEDPVRAAELAIARKWLALAPSV